MLDASAYFAICFMAFLIFTFRPIKNALSGFLDGSIEEIKLDLDTAANRRLVAEKEIKELKAQMSHVKAKHKEMLDNAKVEIQKSFENRCKDFDKTLEYLENNARARMNQMRESAIKELEEAFLMKSLHLVSDHFKHSKKSDLDLAIVSSFVKGRQR